jgi:hypothetical protein
MAAELRNDCSRDWRVTTPQSQDKLTYPRYIAGMDARALSQRTTVVLAAAGLGGSTGMILGGGIGTAVAPGPGTIIGGTAGAGVGAAAGIVFAISTYSCHDYSMFRKYRQSLSVEARRELDEMLNRHPHGAEYLCNIGGVLPSSPVRIKGEPQIYDQEILERRLEQIGTSPVTQKPFRKADIEVALDGFAIIGKICDLVLNSEEERSKHSPEILKGMAILRNETLKQCSKIHKTEVARIMKEFDSKKVSMATFHKSLAALGNALDPVLGDSAVSNRVEYPCEYGVMHDLKGVFRRDRDDRKE